MKISTNELSSFSFTLVFPTLAPLFMHNPLFYGGEREKRNEDSSRLLQSEKRSLFHLLSLSLQLHNTLRRGSDGFIIQFGCDAGAHKCVYLERASANQFGASSTSLEFQFGFPLTLSSLSRVKMEGKHLALVGA